MKTEIVQKKDVQKEKMFKFTTSQLQALERHIGQENALFYDKRNGMSEKMCTFA